MSIERWRLRMEIAKQHGHDYTTTDFDEVALALDVIEAAKEIAFVFGTGAIEQVIHRNDVRSLAEAVQAFEEVDA